MALPPDLTTFTLTGGSFFDAIGATALAGMKGSLTPVDGAGRARNVVHLATGKVMVPLSVPIVVQDDGTWSVSPLPYTDDPAFDGPFRYSVQWQVAGREASPGNKIFEVSIGSGLTIVDYDTLGSASGALVTPAAVPLVTSVVGLSGGVTGADIVADPDVAAAIGAGGGGGISDTDLRATFDSWLATSGVLPPTGGRMVFATTDQALADAHPDSTWIVLTSDATPPAVPTGLTAVAGNRQVTWDWDDNGEQDMSGYQYRIGTTDPPTGAATDVATSTVTVSGLDNGTAYYVQVQAVDTSGNASGWSASVAATPASFVDLAQHAIGRATSATSITTTLDAAPTAGNLLVARLGTDGANADQQTPSGWVKAGSVGGSTSGSIGMYYRVAQDGDPTAWTFTVVNAAELDLGIDEWIGDLTALDVIASGSSGSNATTATMGPTAATATQPELAIAAVHTKGVSGGFGNTWTGGFTQIGANSNQDAAYKPLTTTGDTPSTTETWTTARPAAWMLATFRK